MDWQNIFAATPCEGVDVFLYVCVYLPLYIYISMCIEMDICVCICVSYWYYLPACIYLFLTMHLNAYYVEQQFGWLHDDSSVCYKSPPEHV